MQNYKIRITTQEQLNLDVETVCRAMDDLSAAAIGLTSGNQQSFVQFMQVRDDFKDFAKGFLNQYESIKF